MVLIWLMINGLGFITINRSYFLSQRKQLLFKGNAFSVTDAQLCKWPSSGSDEMLYQLSKLGRLLDTCTVIYFINSVNF